MFLGLYFSTQGMKVGAEGVAGLATLAAGLGPFRKASILRLGSLMKDSSLKLH